MTSRPDSSVPACYALTVQGLESVAADELTQELGAEVRRSSPGQIVFRPESIDERLLRLRTVEDVFLFLWGTDQLTYRAQDLKQITAWTARQPDWPALLRLHHAVHPRPGRKPTYRLVTQMRGQHGYRRVDALKALARGLEGKLPASWRPAEEDADVEVWLTITGRTAICGLRLSDRTMRHRTYKEVHLPASLRPVVAASMVRLARVPFGAPLLDPMCGAGTILAERLAVDRRAPVLGGDLEPAAVSAALVNLRPLGEAHLARWDAERLPFPDASIQRIVCNLPFGKQIGEPEEIGPLYRRVIREWDRVLVPGGRAVLLASDAATVEKAAARAKWKRLQHLRIRVLGQPAELSVWGKR